MELTLMLGAAVGLILGLTGAGGGILAVPALMSGMGWTLQQAAPVALVAVAGSAAIGAAQTLRRGLVRYRAATLMAVAAIPTAVLGVRLAHAMHQQWLTGLFATAMVIVAGRLLLQKQAGEPNIHLHHPCAGCVNPANGHFDWTWGTAGILSFIGACTGLVTGLLGLGGGFILVPLLRRFTNLGMHSIVATSLMVIALVGSSSIVAAVVHGAQLPGRFTALFGLSCAAGMLAGRLVVGWLPAALVQRTFAVLLLLVAVHLLWATR